MSELTSETNPQILVNGEEQEQQHEQQPEQQQEQQHEQQQEQQQGCDEAGVKEEISSGSLDDECSQDSAAEEKETHTKMRSALQQVRSRIRTQAGVRAPKSSILELVHKVKDREMERQQGNSEPEVKVVSSEADGQAEGSKDESNDEMKREEEELCAVFEEKLEASKKALRVEFEVQISQVRKEMQAYTDKAVKDMESKLQSRQAHTLQRTHSKEQQESKGLDKRQKPSAAPTLASRRGRVLTRTMTTILPKTCTPVIVGPRAKSETLASSKGASSRLLSRELALSLSGSKPYQRRMPIPPQHKRPVWSKTKTEN